MAHALIHILGSRSGYTTLDATPGVSAAERAELEVLSFGDATSSEAMARLEHSAVMTGRRLRSGRFAVSRMLPGGVDDAGRPTVEIITLLLDARAYTATAGAFPRLADDARFWRVARGAVATGYELPEDRCAVAASDRGVLRAFDAWIAARKQGGVGVMPAADAGAVLAMVALLESVDQAQCRWGIGLLSLSAPVDLCTLASTASSSGPRPVVRASTGGAWQSPEWQSPEMDHVSWHLEQRNPLLPRTDALVSAVRIEPALDEPASAAPFTRGAAHAQRAPFAMQPRNLTKIAGISAACSLALLAVVTALYARGGRSANVDLPVAAEKEPAVAEETKQPAEVTHGDYDQVPPEQNVEKRTQVPPSPAPSTPPAQAPERIASSLPQSPPKPSGPPQESVPPDNVAPSVPADAVKKDDSSASQLDGKSDEGRGASDQIETVNERQRSPLGKFLSKVRELREELPVPPVLQVNPGDPQSALTAFHAERNSFAAKIVRTWEQVKSELTVAFNFDRDRKQGALLLQSTEGGDPDASLDDEVRNLNGFSIHFNVRIVSKSIKHETLSASLLAEWKETLFELRELVKQLRVLGRQLETRASGEKAPNMRRLADYDPAWDCLFKNWGKWDDDLENSKDELSIELKAVIAELAKRKSAKQTGKGDAAK